MSIAKKFQWAAQAVLNCSRIFCERPLSISAPSELQSLACMDVEVGNCEHPLLKVAVVNADIVPVI